MCYLPDPCSLPAPVSIIFVLLSSAFEGAFPGARKLGKVSEMHHATSSESGPLRFSDEAEFSMYVQESNAMAMKPMSSLIVSPSRSFSLKLSTRSLVEDSIEDLPPALSASVSDPTVDFAVEAHDTMSVPNIGSYFLFICVLCDLTFAFSIAIG